MIYSANNKLVWLGRMVVLQPWFRYLAFIGLCSAYIVGGITKASDFHAAIAELEHFGVPTGPAPELTVATIITELTGPSLILTGRWRWFGALWLAGFTVVASLLANRFWELQEPQRFMVENAFFEHLGLIGGFILVAWIDLKENSTRASSGT